MKNLKLGVLVIFGALTVVSCKKDGLFCKKGNGTMVTEERTISGFSGISLGLDADVLYTQSDEYSVTINASENLMKFIETDVEGSVLDINFKDGKCFNVKNPMTITISSPNMNGFIVSGSGSITSNRKLTTNALEVKVSGSGEIYLDSLNINEMNSEISGSGDIEASSINDMTTQNVKVSGSGNVNFLNMPTLKSSVKVSGSGNCDVNVINTLDIIVSGSGSVRYKGNPVVVSTISGSGSVTAY